MILWLLAACDPTPGDSASPDRRPVDSSVTGDTADSGDTGDTADSVDSGDSADTGDSGDPWVVDEAVDVVIIGAGVAGLSAAIEAREAGASVVILEREPEAGGAAMWAGGLMMFSGSPEQASAGIVDSPEQLAAEWPDFTGGDVTDPWFQFFAENNVAMVHDWLEGFGVSWTVPGGDPSSGVTDRVEEVEGEGEALVQALLDQQPDLDLRLASTAEELLVHDGRVAGVRWTDASGEHTLGADAVIVATGGFLRDLDRVRALFPELDDTQLAYGSFVGADGAGLTMLEGLGARTQNLQAIGFYAHGTLDPDTALSEVVTLDMSSAPWVNLSAERFVDESGVNSFIVGRTRVNQPGGLAWLVADRHFEATRFLNPATGRFRSLEELVNAGIALRADDLDALAGSVGLDATTLGTTVAEWNDSADGRVTDPYRDPAADPGVPVRDAPFYAVPVAASAAKAFGGVDVDLQGRVLDTDGNPIPGVYAAGEVSGMAGGSMVGDYGFTGSLTAVVLGGRVAGENAGAEAVGR